ncbi:hypothetical protein ACFMPD_08845 [Sedimentitalea sp. HM32M-2]|uniref:hypothetical protein n=1 Tax=Sedimentitalea sp. HM32M-2 TaxID=3351566 RepID=UPI00362C7375
MRTAAHRKFIALIVGTAIAITGVTAVPARADQADVARVLAGLAAFAILGAAIRSSRDDNQQTVSRHPPYDYENQDYQNQDYQARNPQHRRARPLPQSVVRYDLPARCLRNHGSRGGPRRMLGMRCLQQNYRFAKALPQACRVRFETRNMVRVGYAPGCLKKRGYRIVPD